MTDANAKERLLEETRESYEQARSEQEAALAQIAGEGAFVRTETVRLGGLDIDIRKWLADDDIKRVKTFQELPSAESDLQDRHLDVLLDKRDDVIDLLTSLSVSDTYDEAFWDLFYEDYGPIGAYLALMTMLEPVLDNMEVQGEQLGNLRERVGDGPSD